jgi:hypothetical protein
MSGLRVGVEIAAPPAAVAATMATLPWMAPERISLDDDRSLLLLCTSFGDADEACAYAERRVQKSAAGIGVDIAVVSSEAYPITIDLRTSGEARQPSDPRS